MSDNQEKQTDAGATTSEKETTLPVDIQDKTTDLPDDLVLFISDQHKKKKEANAQAAEYRKQLESVAATQLEREKEIEAQFQEKYRALEEQYNSLNSELQRKKAEKAKAELDAAMEKNKPHDEKIISNLLKEHITSISEDKEAIASFSVADWMAGMTESHSFLFKSEERKPANSGFQPEQATGEGKAKPNDTTSKSLADINKNLSDWELFTKDL